MKQSLARQYEQNQRRQAEHDAVRGIAHVGGGEAHKAPGTFTPRSHGWCGSHNRNTKADSGTRQRAYPRALFTTHWVSVGGTK